MNIIPETRHAH